MATKYFNDYQLAHDFYSAQQGDCSIGQVRKDLVEDLGRWVVQYDPALLATGKKLIAHHNGKVATRATKNIYAAAVVAEDANGKLLILSAHYTAEQAHKAAANHWAGDFVNFNYRKAVTRPVVLTGEA